LFEPSLIDVTTSIPTTTPLFAAPLPSIIPGKSLPNSTGVPHVSSVIGTTLNAGFLEFADDAIPIYALSPNP